MAAFDLQEGAPDRKGESVVGCGHFSRDFFPQMNALLGVVGFGLFCCFGASHAEGATPSVKDVVGVLSKSVKQTANHDSAFGFRKETTWDGGPFMGISVSGNSSRGIYVAAGIIYHVDDQAKIQRESYWCDGIKVTREAFFGGQYKDWEISEAPEASDPLSSIRFESCSEEAFLASTSKAGALKKYVLLSSGKSAMPRIREILEDEHSMNMAPDEYIAEPTMLRWTVLLDPKTHLIHEVKREIHVEVKPKQDEVFEKRDKLLDEIEALPPEEQESMLAQVDELNELIGMLSGNVNHNMTLKMDHITGIALEIPGEVKAMLDARGKLPKQTAE